MGVLLDLPIRSETIVSVIVIKKYIKYSANKELAMIGNSWNYAKEHKSEIAYRGWNGLTAIAVAYDLYTDPAASVSESLPDILLHGVEAIIPNFLPRKVMIGLNVLRGTQAGIAFLTNEAVFISMTPSDIPMGFIGIFPKVSLSWALSKIPKAANGVDVINHGINIVKHYLRSSPETKENEALASANKPLIFSKQPKKPKVDSSKHTLDLKPTTAKAQRRKSTSKPGASLTHQ
jgi:hypothetical protein